MGDSDVVVWLEVINDSSSSITRCSGASVDAGRPARMALQ